MSEKLDYMEEMMKKALGLLLVCSVCFSGVRDELLDGVKSIDSGGVPGAILCLDSSAHPLVMGNVSGAKQAVAAYAEYGRGRIVALSHPSFCNADSLKKVDTRRFMQNALSWLNQSQGKIFVYKYNEANVGMSELGASVVEDLSALNTCGVLITYPDSLPAGDLDVVRDFIKGGGGLLCTGIGWGWQQLNPSKTLRDDNQFNKLLGPAGLLVNNEYAHRTGNGYVTEGPLPKNVNVREALEFAKTFEAQLKQVNNTLISARSVLPTEGSALKGDLEAFVGGSNRRRYPTVERPWRSSDLRDRLGAVAFTSDWQASLGKRCDAHPGARSYPGLPEKDVMVTKELEFDLSRPRWHSTGLFAVAGKPVEVTVPEGYPALRLRIGTTTCDNTRHDSWSRMPKVDMEVPLQAGKNEITSPFGGLIYLVVPSNRPRLKEYPASKLSGRIKVTIGNACPSAWYKIGRDTLPNWSTQLAECPSPWVEIESDKIILTVKKSDAKLLENPDELMAVWDKVADLNATLTCLPLSRPSQERFCMDDQLCAGWMHAGYPIMLPMVTAKDLLNAKKLTAEGDWGFYHEIGHNHQNYDWTFDGTGEVTVNFFTLYVMEKLCGKKPRDTRMDEAKFLETVKRWVKNGKKYDDWKSDPFLALEMFVRLQVAYGWETFETMFAEYRELPDDKRPKNDQDKRDMWVLNFSRLTGDNIASVFDAWNVPISDSARQACAKYGKPKDDKLFAGIVD